MNRLLPFLLIVLVSSTGPVQAQVDWGGGTEIKLGADMLIPAEDDDWEIAYGFSGRLVLWSPEVPQAGLIIAAGGQTWQVNDTSYSDSFGRYRFNGTASMIPFGASLAMRFPFGAAGKMTVEGGMRYVFVDSDVTFVTTEFATDDEPGVVWSSEIDVGDGIVGLVGVELEIPVGVGIALYGGGGYQFDASRGKYEIDGVDIGYRNSLAAVYLGAGLKLEF